MLTNQDSRVVEKHTTEWNLTPKEIVEKLDQYIVGQNRAKKLVAVALRNRWRRQKVAAELRSEITPKNILMIGATGIGKTEIARRLAKLLSAPFLKIEASKYTEVGYVGRDVESMIRDLVEVSFNLVREEQQTLVAEQAKKIAEERIIEKIVPAPPIVFSDNQTPDAQTDYQQTKNIFLQKLRNQELNSKEIEIELLEKGTNMVDVFSIGNNEMIDQFKDLISNLTPQKKRKRKIPVKDALKLIIAEETEKLLDIDAIKAEAVKRAEHLGIIFIDEVDKIAKRYSENSAEVSREGVQRDLLPIVEGCVVATKYGNVHTDHILFIAAGAFHVAKPSDLIPELQGRFPIRVELDSLTQDDLFRVLKEPKQSLIVQYEQLMAVEGVQLSFEDDALREMAKIAFDVNAHNENIGARRLQALMEKILEDICFNETNQQDKKIVITTDYVLKMLAEVLNKQDLARYIL